MSQAAWSALPQVIDLAQPHGSQGHPVWHIVGEDYSEFFGSEVTTGDIDGDGFDDLIVRSIGVLGHCQGCEEYNNSDTISNAVRSGTINVIFGDAGQAGTSLELRDMQTSRRWARFVVPSVPSNDPAKKYFWDFGISPRCADFNGDGYDDIAVIAEGIRCEFSPSTLLLPDDSTKCEARGVVILYGGPSIPGTVTDISEIDPPHGMAMILGPPEVEVTYQTGADYRRKRFARAIAPGDFDGDGLADIAMACEGIFPRSYTPDPCQSDPQPTRPAGGTYIVYGRELFPGAEIDLRDEPQVTEGTVIIGAEYPDSSLSITSGDFNGDGLDDVVVTDYFQNPGDIWPNCSWWDGLTDPGVPTVQSGIVTIVYGDPVLHGKTIDLAEPLGSHGETRITGEERGDEVGISAYTAQDINGDGIDDLLLSTQPCEFPSDWELYPEFSGEITLWNNAEGFIIYGSATKPGTPVQNGSLVNLDADPGTHGETRIVYTRIPNVFDYQLSGSGAVITDIDGNGAPEIFRRSDVETPWNLHIWPMAVGKPGVPVLQGSIFDRRFNPPDTIIWGPLIYDAEHSGQDPRTRMSLHWMNIDGAMELGDVDGDGATDLPFGISDAHNPAFPGIGNFQSNDFGAVFVLMGVNDFPTTTYSETIRGNGLVRRGFGGRLSPIARTWMKVLGAASHVVTTTISRTKQGISNLGGGNLNDIADVFWNVSTQTSGLDTAQLTFQYLDSEIDGLTEQGLTLFQAPALGGPWTEIAQQWLNVDSNEIVGTVNSLGYFAIAENLSRVQLYPPRVRLIRLLDPNPTSLDSVRFLVEFTEPVLGVDLSDFRLNTQALVGSELVSISGENLEWTVTARSGEGTGRLALELIDDGSIVDTENNALVAKYSDDAHFLSPAYQVTRPTRLIGITRLNSNPTSANTVRYAVAFSTEVFNVDEDDFLLHYSGLSSPPAIESISQDHGREIEVSVSTGTGDGTLRLDLIGNGSIVDIFGWTLHGIPVGARVQGERYTIDRPDPDLEPPVIAGISRASVNPTSAVSVAFYVWFSEEVQNVKRSDFRLTVTGITGAAIAEVTGDGIVRTVSVSTGNGDGTIRLDVVDDDSIQDMAGNVLGGAGNNDYDNGSVYSIFKSDPGALPAVVTSIMRSDTSPTAAQAVAFVLTFSEPVTGVDIEDFELEVDGLIGSRIDSIKGSGTARTVYVRTGNGAGTLRLSLIDNDTIRDAHNNPLGGIGNDNGSFMQGEVYVISRPQTISLRKFNREEDVVAEVKYKLKWKSGAIGKKVRIELWRHGNRVAVLVPSTKNDGVRKISIPDSIFKGSGYKIRVVCKKDSDIYAESKKNFAIE